MLRICSSPVAVYEIPDERAQLKLWLVDPSATWAGLRKDITSPAEALCGGMKGGQQRLLCHWIRAVWKREPGKQEIHCLTDFLLACDLPTRLPRDEGDGDLYNAVVPNDCFFYKATKASHKSAVPWTRLEEQTHTRLEEQASAGEPPDDGSYSLSLYQWRSNEKTTSSNELCQWDGIGVVVVLWFGGVF